MWKSESTAPRDGAIVARVEGVGGGGVSMRSSRVVVWHAEQKRWMDLWHPQDDIVLVSWLCEVPSIEDDEIASA